MAKFLLALPSLAREVCACSRFKNLRTQTMTVAALGRCHVSARRRQARNVRPPYTRSLGATPCGCQRGSLYRERPNLRRYLDSHIRRAEHCRPNQLKPRGFGRTVRLGSKVRCPGCNINTWLEHFPRRSPVGCSSPNWAGCEHPLIFGQPIGDTLDRLDHLKQRGLVEPQPRFAADRTDRKKSTS